MKKNKLVLFDWGGIVEKHAGKNGMYQQFDGFLRELGLLGKTDLGEYSLSSKASIEDIKFVFKDLSHRFNLTITFEEFLNTYYKYYDKVEYFKDVSEFEKSLKDKCFIGILSNLSVLDKSRIDKQLNLSEYDYVFLSFEIGEVKPNKEIYEYVLNNVPFKGSDILFLDDAESNINAALSLGINACLVKGEDLDNIKLCVNKFLDE